MAWNHSPNSNYPVNCLKWNYIMAACFVDGDKVATSLGVGSTPNAYWTASSLGIVGKLLHFNSTTTNIVEGSPLNTGYHLPGFTYTPVGARMTRQFNNYVETGNAQAFTVALAVLYNAQKGPFGTGLTSSSWTQNGDFSNQLGCTISLGAFGTANKDVYMDTLSIGAGINATNYNRQLDVSFFLPQSQLSSSPYVTANLAFREMILQCAIYHDLRSYRNKWLRSRFNITNVARTSDVVTLTTSATHTYAVGDTVKVAAVTNTGVNTSSAVLTGVTSTTMTYTLAGADITSAADTGTVGAPMKMELYAGTTLNSSFDPDNPPGSDTLLATFELYSNDFSSIAWPTNLDGKFSSQIYPTVTCVGTGTVAYAKLIAATTTSGQAAHLFMPCNTSIANNYAVLNRLSLTSGGSVQLLDLGFQIGMW